MWVKLHGSILDSSIWAEDHATLRVWITMLVMADREGVVTAALTALRRRAGVTADECLRALNTFLSPDPKSQSPERDGRRVVPVKGGWRLVNYSKYREMRTAEQVQTAARMKRMREAHKKSGKSVTCDALLLVEEAPKKAPKKAPAAKKVRAPVEATWLTPYLDLFALRRGFVQPSRFARVMAPIHKALGPEQALEVLENWTVSDAAKFGPEWFATNWRDFMPQTITLTENGDLSPSSAKLLGALFKKETR